MLQLRTTHFSDPVQYFFDCAQEARELDAGSALTLELYGDEELIKAVIDGPGPIPQIQYHHKNREAKCLQLAAMADDMLPHIPEDHRCGIARFGLVYLIHSIYDLADTMAWWTIEDEIDGGCMEPYRKRARCRPNGVAFKRTMRRLMSPKFIRRYVKTNVAQHAYHLRALQDVVLRRAKLYPPRKNTELMQLYRQQQDNAKPLHDRMMAAAFPKALPPPPSKANRRVIKRSLNIATSLLGEETVRSFLRGEVITLLGNDAMLKLRKRASLAKRGHGCLSVVVADRQGTTLADLCTYIEDTPTLDQLCGFALWMNSGQEKRILETANITQLEQGAGDHPIIQHHYEHKRLNAVHELVDDRAVYDIATGRVIHRHRLTHEEKRERARQYWEATNGEWLEAMYVAIIGYRNFPTYKLAGAL